MDVTEVFEAERPRLVLLAGRVLGDRVEAEDVVQQAWLRLHRAEDTVEDVPAWLTTVTTRLCLDRLRVRVPVPVPHEVLDVRTAADPSEDVVLATAVGAALDVVLDRLSPRERVAFVLHDSFAVDFPTIAAVLGTTPTAARKLASRARAKVRQPRTEDGSADAAVVDAFMAAAREGDFERLLRVLAPDVSVDADEEALAVGTPAGTSGREPVARFFLGRAAAALPVLVGDRPGAAWFHRGQARVLFDITVRDGLVTGIVFRAAPDVLAQVVRRRGGDG